MIKITRKLVSGFEVGKPFADKFVLYKGIDTKTKLYAACLALPEQIKDNPGFDKMIRARIRFIIKNRIGETNDQNKME